MLTSSKIVTFFCGFCIGVFLYKLFHSAFLKHRFASWLNDSDKLSTFRNGITSKEWTDKHFLEEMSNHINSLKNNNKIVPDTVLGSVEVTCVVFVHTPKNAYLIHNTWGRKCNSLRFYSKIKDNFIDTDVIPFVDKWQYFCESLRHLWNHKKDLKWVLFSPDDVYVIPENLKYFLASKDYDKPYYFGHNVLFWKQMYNSDKTSFVLSKGAVVALISRFNNSSSCFLKNQLINDAAFNLGQQLSSIGIHAGDSRDYFGRERFHTFSFEQLVSEENPGIINKYSKTSVHPVKQGKDCCSDTSISFRIAQNDRIYFYYYLLNQVKISPSFKSNYWRRIQPDDNMVWVDFVHKELGNVNLSSITPEKYYELWRSRTWEPEEFNRKMREEIMSKINSFL